jgi:hypothetical protein
MNEPARKECAIYSCSATSPLQFPPDQLNPNQSETNHCHVARLWHWGRIIGHDPRTRGGEDYREIRPLSERSCAVGVIIGISKLRNCRDLIVTNLQVDLPPVNVAARVRDPIKFKDTRRVGA